MLEGKRRAVAKVDGDRGQVSMARNWWMGGILTGSHPRGEESREMTCWKCVCPTGACSGVGESRMLEWLTATGKKKRKSKGLSGGAYRHVIQLILD